MSQRSRLNLQDILVLSLGSRMKRSVELNNSLKEVQREVASWPEWMRGRTDTKTLRKMYVEVRTHSRTSSERDVNGPGIQSGRSQRSPQIRRILRGHRRVAVLAQ